MIKISQWAALLGLILLAVHSLGRLPPWHVASPAPEQSQSALLLQQQLAQSLASAAPAGLVPLLARYAQQPGVLELRLIDRGGRQVAAYPSRITPGNWGLLATPAAWLREQILRIATVPTIQPVEYGNQRYGQLEVYRWRGADWMRAPVLAHLALLLLAMVGSIGSVYSLLPATSGRSGPPARSAVSADTGRRAAADGTPAWGRHLRPALDALQAGLVVLDGQLRVRFINERAAGWCGWSRSEALGLPIGSVLRLTDAPFADWGHAIDVPTSASGGWPLTISRRDGRHQVLEATWLSLAAAADDVSQAGALLLLREPAVPSAAPASAEREVELARKTLDQLADGVAVTDKFGRIVRVNQRMNRMFAYAQDELNGVAIAKLLPVPFLNEPSITLHHYVGGDNEKLPRVVGWRKDATTFPVELSVQELVDPDYAFLLLIRDSGERRRRENISMRLGRLLDYAAEEIYIFDAHSLYFTEANREACDNIGYSADQLTRMTPLHLAPGLDRNRFENDLAGLRSGDKRQVVYRTEHRRADGSRYPVSLRLSFSREEEPPVFMSLVQDTSDQRAAETRLEFLAHNDALTGLPNRSALMGHLQHLLAARRGDQRLLLYFLDVDQFKQINDTHGHAVGDEVLQEVAARLRAATGSDEYFVARLAGDEFIIAALRPADEVLDSLAQRIEEAMDLAVSTSAGGLALRLSIGMAWSEPDDTAASLIQRADVAMYRAKGAGGGSAQ